MSIYWPKGSFWESPAANDNQEAFHLAFPEVGEIYNEAKAEKESGAKDIKKTTEKSHRTFMSLFNRKPEAIGEVKSAAVKQYMEWVVTDTTHILLDEAGWKVTVAANDNNKEKLAA